MSVIKVMSENLANKIAAGEVVEKCSSVVKELVENSIDAKSKNIKINLLKGGLEEITIIDDGIGMDESDAELAFMRHATSKIYKDDDLFFIDTLGFRGEALPSIASVSEVELITCAGEVGTRIHIKGGNLLEKEPASSRIGTKITITNLFYNTPARLKHLKTESAELASVVGFIEKLALAKPEISFTLTNNDNIVVKTTGSGNLLKTIHEIYGLNVSSNALEIKALSDDFEISGYICKPSILKKNRNHFNTFVNGRIIKNNDINRAINDAYNTYKHDGFYPVVIINIYADPTLVDVNIHPTKQDVKISKINDLTDLIYNTIKNTLYNNLLIPNATIVNDAKKIDKENYLEEVISEEVKKENVQFTMDLATNEVVNEEKNKEFKNLKLYPVAQVHGTYIIAENEDGMFIIDQHAAHERVNYERVTKEYKQEKVNCTDLLVPLPIELSPSDYEIFIENKYVLEELGFTFTEFGINTILIKTHPTWLTMNYEGDNLKFIIDLLIEMGSNFNKDKYLDSLVKMASCKMSVKANEHLSMNEMEKLLDDLVKCDNPYNCCHGRPSIFKLSNYDLEKMFKRVM